MEPAAEVLPIPTKAVIGRPYVVLTPEYTDILLESIATNVESLSSIVGRLQKEYTKFPSCRVVYERLRTDENFYDLYMKAKGDQSDLLVDEMISIADDDSEDEQGNTSVQRCKLRVETRKWVASKLKPKIYGDRADRLAVNIQINNDSSPIDLSSYSM